MAIRIRKHGTVTASFATAQQVDISHLNDSIRLGDGTDLQTFVDVGGIKCTPVKLYGGGGDASASNQTSGAQKTQIVDDSGANTVDATAVGGGVYALKVDVVSTVGGGAAPSATDGAAYVAGTSQFTPIGAARDDASVGTMAEDKYGILRMTTQRGLHMNLRDSAGAEITTLPVSIAAVLHIDDNSGSLTVDNGGTFAVQDSQVIADNAGFTDGTTKLFMGGYIFDEVAGTALTENDAAAARVNANRAVVSTIEDGATRARYATVTAANALKVDASGVAVPITDNAGSLTCDFVAASAKVDVGLINAVTPLMGNGVTGTGSMRVTIASDNTANSNNWNNNIAAINAVVPLMGAGNTGTGSLRVTVASDQVDIGVKQATASNLNAQAVGNVAHDGAASGNPVAIAGRAKNTNPTSVADGDVSYFNTDLAGRQIVAMSDRALVVRSATITITNTTETTIIAAGAASVFHDLTMLVITNTSATAVRVDIRDATAGTIQFAVAIAANGGAVIPFGMCPLNQTTAANNWTAQLSGSVTDIRILATAIKRLA